MIRHQSKTIKNPRKQKRSEQSQNLPKYGALCHCQGPAKKTEPAGFWQEALGYFVCFVSIGGNVSFSMN